MAAGPLGVVFYPSYLLNAHLKLFHISDQGSEDQGALLYYSLRTLADSSRRGCQVETKVLLPYSQKVTII